MKAMLRIGVMCLMVVMVMVVSSASIVAASLAPAAVGAVGLHLSPLLSLGLVGFGTLALVEANLAWQSVNIALANANPCIQLAFKALKTYLSQAKGAKKLIFKPFTEADADAAGGTAIITDPLTLHGVFTKKENSATDNWTWIYDDATNDGTAADARVCIPQFIANEENCFISPAGIAMAAGVVVTQYVTDPLGASDGSTGAAGFVLGAAA